MGGREKPHTRTHTHTRMNVCMCVCVAFLPSILPCTHRETYACMCVCAFLFPHPPPPPPHTDTHPWSLYVSCPLGGLMGERRGQIFAYSPCVRLKETFEISFGDWGQPPPPQPALFWCTTTLCRFLPGRRLPGSCPIFVQSEGRAVLLRSPQLLRPERRKNRFASKLPAKFR